MAQRERQLTRFRQTKKLGFWMRKNQRLDGVSNVKLNYYIEKKKQGYESKKKLKRNQRSLHLSVKKYPWIFIRQINLLKLINMALNNLYKTKASSLAKIATLPVFRHPADLLNQHTQSFNLQKKQINGQLSWGQGKYFSHPHFQLAKFLGNSRKQYRSLAESAARQTLARRQYHLWNNYLNCSLKDPKVKLNELQKAQIYEAMLTAKQRNEQRLALSRFIKFGYEYSQAFKVDIPLNPIVIMKLVHPHFGYLNLIPNQNQYKYTHDQLFDLIEQFNVASQIRETGNTIHSTQLLSFIFWRILSNNKARIEVSKFIELLKVFKFSKVTEQNFSKTFDYSIKQGEISPQDNHIRFDLFRQIFIDRDL